MQRDFNKVVLVTGAGSGIGRATALKFAEAGYKVVVADIDEIGGLETADMIKRSSGTSAFFKCDVSVEEEVIALMKFIKAEFNGLHAAYNNAGIDKWQYNSATIEKANWDRVLAVNLTGTFLCCKHEIPLMLASGGGSIINCSSTAGKVGNPMMVAYSASKHGIIGLTKSIAAELGPHGIRVNAVCPGYTESAMTIKARQELSEQNVDILAYVKSRTPMARAGEPNEIAEAVLWLASNKSSFVTGTALDIDGGSLA